MRPRTSMMTSSIAGFTLLLGLAFLSISSASGQSSIDVTLRVSPSPPPTLIPTIPADNVLELQPLKSLLVSPSGSITNLAFRSEPNSTRNNVLIFDTNNEPDTFGLVDVEEGTVVPDFFQAGPNFAGYQGASFSLDGSRALGVYIFVAYLWDTQTGEVIEQFLDGYKDDTSLGKPLAITPDGQRAIFFPYASPDVQDGFVIIDLNTGERTTLLRSAAVRVNAVAISPDQSSIAAIDHEGAVYSFNIETGLIEFSAYGLWAQDCSSGCSLEHPLVFSSDSQYLAWVVQLGVAYHRDHSVTSPRVFVTDTTGQFPPRAFTFSPDSRYLVVADGNNQLRIWDIANEQEVYRTNIEPAGRVTALAFNQAGTLLAAAIEGAPSDTGTLTGYITLWSVGP